MLNLEDEGDLAQELSSMLKFWCLSRSHAMQDSRIRCTKLFKASVCFASSSACVSVVLSCCNSSSRADGTGAPLGVPAV